MTGMADKAHVAHEVCGSLRPRRCRVAAVGLFRPRCRPKEEPGRETATSVAYAAHGPRGVTAHPSDRSGPLSPGRLSDQVFK